MSGQGAGTQAIEFLDAQAPAKPFFLTTTWASPNSVTPPQKNLDLYAGAGLFAIPLARRGHMVVAVEENRAAVADAEASARVNCASAPFDTG